MIKTVAEIGQMVGCSTATVSRALNNSPSVSPKLRDAVLKVIKDNHYKARRTRRSAKSAAGRDAMRQIEIILYRHTPMERISAAAGELAVGDLSPVPSQLLTGPYRLTNSFYRQIIDGMLDELRRWDYEAVLRNCPNVSDSRFLLETNQPNKQGVLVVGEYGPDLETFVGQCSHPLVLVDLIYPGARDVVTTDNQAGIGSAFNYLYSLGHREFGFVGGPEWVIGFAERYRAFQFKMAGAGIVLRPEWVYHGSNHIDQTARGVETILRQARRPTAMICVNDCAALGVLRAASHAGLRVPADLSVIGFDDQESAGMVTPALTTVRVPMTAMGRRAVRELMIQLQSHRQGGEFVAEGGAVIRLLPELVVRQSTAAPCACS